MADSVLRDFWPFVRWAKHFSASSACARRRWWPGVSTGFTPPGIPPLRQRQLMGCGWVISMWHAGAGGLNPPRPWGAAPEGLAGMAELGPLFPGGGGRV
jgi:hypothetical protein